MTGPIGRQRFSFQTGWVPTEPERPEPASRALGWPALAGYRTDCQALEPEQELLGLAWPELGHQKDCQSLGQEQPGQE